MVCDCLLDLCHRWTVAAAQLGSGTSVDRRYVTGSNPWLILRTHPWILFALMCFTGLVFARNPKSTTGLDLRTEMKYGNELAVMVLPRHNLCRALLMTFKSCMSCAERHDRVL